MWRQMISQDPVGVLLAAVLLLLGGVVVAGGLLHDVTTAKRRQLQARLVLIKAFAEGEALTADDADGVVKTAESQGMAGRFRTFILQAGGWRAMQFSVLVGVVVAILTGILADFIFLAGDIPSILIGLGLGGLTYRHQMGEARRRRQLAFLDDLPTAIDLIVRVVQAGLPITDAITVAGNEVKGPVGTEFSAIAHLVQLGVDLKEALYEAANRLQLVDFDCFVVSLVVQRETGGQLSEVLGNLSTIVRRRKETRAKAKGLTAEGRLTVKVVAALPFLTAGGLAVASPTYMMPLITEPLGRHMLLAALGCLALGLVAVSRLTKMEL